MTDDDLAFIEADRTELLNRAEHYRKQFDAALKHHEKIDKVHRRHVATLEATILEFKEKLEYQTRRAEANWAALCECRNEELK